MDLSKVDSVSVVDQHGRILSLEVVSNVTWELTEDGKSLRISLETQVQTG